MPPCTAGWSVLTRPSSISGKEVSACEEQERERASEAMAGSETARLHLLHGHARSSQGRGAAAGADQLVSQGHQSLWRVAERGPPRVTDQRTRGPPQRCEARTCASSRRPALSKTEMSARGWPLEVAAAGVFQTAGVRRAGQDVQSRARAARQMQKGCQARRRGCAPAMARVAEARDSAGVHQARCSTARAPVRSCATLRSDVETALGRTAGRRSAAVRA